MALRHGNIGVGKEVTMDHDKDTDQSRGDGSGGGEKKAF
jgi:hypothetical protein